ncbi:thioredoxin domain-containing protein [Bradyrhizobium sp. TZ2]
MPAQGAADVAKPQSLPDMALGPANASVTITEYTASMTCPHCAAFAEQVFPKIKSEFIDSGKIRYVFREFRSTSRQLRDRCWRAASPRTTPRKYFAVIDLLFRQQNDWVAKNTTETLIRIGKQAGLTQTQVEDCLKDQALLDKIAAETRKFASEVLKVTSTPTFFINGEMIKGEQSFEEFLKAHQCDTEELIRFRWISHAAISPAKDWTKAPQKALGKAPRSRCPSAPVSPLSLA